MEPGAVGIHSGGESMTRAAIQPARKSTRQTVKAQAKPTGTGQDSRQADQGPDLDRIWATALDLPPVRQDLETFDHRPTAVSRIMVLVADCKRWGDETVARWIEGNPDRWGVIHRHLNETEAFLSDAVPGVPARQVKAAARECCVGFIQYRLLERGTISEYRARLAAAWRKLHVGEERLP